MNKLTLSIIHEYLLTGGLSNFLIASLQLGHVCTFATSFNETLPTAPIPFTVVYAHLLAYS